MTHLQKIVARAKQIRKAHPKKLWTDCIKAASKELKKAAPKKTVAKKAVAKKRVAGLDKVVKRGNHTSVEYSRKPKATKKKPTQGKLFGVVNKKPFSISLLRKIYPKDKLGVREKAALMGVGAKITYLEPGLFEVGNKNASMMFTYKHTNYKDFTIVG